LKSGLGSLGRWLTDSPFGFGSASISGSSVVAVSLLTPPVSYDTPNRHLILFVAGFGVAVAYTTLGGRSASTVKTASATTASFSEAASAATEEKKYPAPPEMKIDVNKTYTATLTTTKGDIVLTLFARKRPRPSTTLSSLPAIISMMACRFTASSPTS